LITNTSQKIDFDPIRFSKKNSILTSDSIIVTSKKIKNYLASKESKNFTMMMMMMTGQYQYVSWSV